MNLYGYVNCFPSNSALTYWAQAASIAGLAPAETILTSSGFGLKKSQLPLATSDIIHKNRLVLSTARADELTALFPMSPRVIAYSGDLSTSLNHIHHHHQQQQQLQHNQHFFSTSPPLGSGLGPLQALCESDVTSFTSKSSIGPTAASPSRDPKEGLKFGISRILSDDFGKSRCEKENNFQLSAVPEACRSLTLCPCNSIACTAYTSSPSPYHKGPIPSLSAVHALQPPSYPLSSSADALPGPYSILSADNSFPNQPKRKRSWSRAVFSNLQRKGLERRFEVQKYVTKPDRRQLAAMLGLTDAQVKVWFQNRRMKWRHAQQQGEKDKQTQQPEQQQGSELTKQETVSGDTLEVSKPTIRKTVPDDVIDFADDSPDLYHSVSGINFPGKEVSQVDVTLRQACSSPQDLSVRHHGLSELGFGVTTRHDMSSEPSMEVARESSTTQIRHLEHGHSSDRDVNLSRSHRMCESLSEEDTSRSSDALGGQLDVSDISPACLGANSDLDVNDSDVNMNDTNDDDREPTGNVDLR